MEEDYSRKTCSFRENHYCSKCGMFDMRFKKCVLFGINSNLGRMAQNKSELLNAELSEVKRRLGAIQQTLENIGGKLS